MKKVIESLSLFYQNHPDLNIVLGGDFNNNNVPYRYENFGDNSISCFPKSNKCPSTIKKRTFLQSQKSKGDWVEQKCRDYFLTSMKVKEGSLLAFNSDGKLSEYYGPDPNLYQYLPNENHLFGHVAVSVTLNR